MPRGALSIYTGGGVPWHIKRGIFGTDMSRKRGSLQENEPKKGGIRYGQSSEKGGLRN